MINYIKAIEEGIVKTIINVEWFGFNPMLSGVLSNLYHAKIEFDKVKNKLNGSIPNQDQQNCVFNPSGEKKPGVCVIPAKAIRKEGESEEKNIRHDKGFES